MVFVLDRHHKPLMPCTEKRARLLLERGRAVMHRRVPYQRLAPLIRVDLELAYFDTQKLVAPEIAGVEYQQGTLQGYEVRAYLLEKFGRRCVYCGVTDAPLEVEHVVPRRRGGSSRVSNLALACHDCNQAKGNRTAAEFGHPDVQAQAQRPLKDAAAVNATRRAVRSDLQALGLAVACWTGGRTRWNRSRFAVEKTHARDALCVGGLAGVTDAVLPTLAIRATGRGRHCRTNVNALGFPRGYLARQKRVHGFQTGDLVRAAVLRGKHAGTHTGRVAVRANGAFRVGTHDGIGWHCCTLLQRADGYDYATDQKGQALPYPRLKPERLSLR